MLSIDDLITFNCDLKKGRTKRLSEYSLASIKQQIVKEVALIDNRCKEFGVDFNKPEKDIMKAQCSPLLGDLMLLQGFVDYELYTVYQYILEYVLSRVTDSVTESLSTDMVARWGRLLVLYAIRENNNGIIIGLNQHVKGWREWFSDDAFNAAALQVGQRVILDLLYHGGGEEKMRPIKSARMIKYKSIPIIGWFIEYKMLSLRDNITYFFEEGDMDLIKYLHDKHYISLNGLELVAVRTGSLEKVKFLFDNGTFVFSADVVATAIMHSNTGPDVFDFIWNHRNAKHVLEDIKNNDIDSILALGQAFLSSPSAEPLSRELKDDIPRIQKNIEHLRKYNAKKLAEKKQLDK